MVSSLSHKPTPFLPALEEERCGLSEVKHELTVPGTTRGQTYHVLVQGWAVNGTNEGTHLGKDTPNVILGFLLPPNKELKLPKRRAYAGPVQH